MADQIPPPPPGFQMVQPMGQGVPPPPPGFQMLPHPAMPSATTQPPSSDYSPAEIAAMSPEDQAFLQREQQGAAQLRQAPSIGTQLADATLRTSGNVTKGLGSLIDLPIDLTNRAIEHFGGPQDYFKTIHGLVDSTLQKADVPQSSTPTGRVVDRIEQGVGGMLGGMGLGSAMSSAASPVARTVGQALIAQPGAQLAATVAGSGAGGVAHEAGLSPKAELAWSLLGGLAPAAGEATAVGAARGAGRLIGAASPEATRLANLAESAGIPLKASQIADSKVAKLVDSATSQVPFSGAAKFQDAQQQAFNRAVGQTIGIDAQKITPEAFAGAVKRIGGEFDRLTANNNIPITPDLGRKLQAVAQDAQSFYGPEAKSMVDSIIQRLVSQSQNGTIPGRVYQSIDSKLGSAIRSGGERSKVLGDLQEVLRDAMGANIKPEDAAAWAQARQQWKDMRTIEPLVGKSTTGDISPAQLMGRVTGNNAGKVAMARGTRGDLGDLARIGQRFLKDVVPDSGTARRTAVIDALKAPGAVVGSALGTGAAINPLAGLLTGAGAVGISRTVQNMLKNPRLVESILNNPNANAQLKQQLQQALGASIDPTAQSLRLQGQ
ncbi:hypothetical protein ACO2Q2_16560 [Dyella sp. KRB-257]|uniref:hypothetical protein n=1 Tax=Dyella sp. KRB-257 TaxID=3400915 RepID=UPI003C03B1EC